MISGYLSPDGQFYNAPYWSHLSTAQRIVENNGWFSENSRDWPTSLQWLGAMLLYTALTFRNMR